MSTIRVVLLVAPAPAGGLETVVVSLAGLASQGGLTCDLVVLDQLAGAHPFVETARRAGLDPVSVPSGRRRYLAEAGAVAKLVRERGAELIHSHGYHADLVGWVAARRSGRPLISTAHGVTGGDLKNRAFEALQHLAFRSFDRVIAVSADLAERLVRAGVPRQRLVVVRNAFAPGAGLDRAAARAALGIPAADFRLGFVGRMSAEKGPDVLLEACSQIADRPVTVSMLGDGPERPALETRAAALHITDRVTWHGTVPGAGTLLAAFDGVVLSSRTEGTPMVLLEAMAAGVPVVATAVGGVPDVVSGAEALLVPPERPDALAAALRALHDDRAGAAVRATAARARLAAEFAPGPWIARHAALYAEVLAARGRRGTAA